MKKRSIIDGISVELITKFKYTSELFFQPAQDVKG